MLAYEFIGRLSNLKTIDITKETHKSNFKSQYQCETTIEGYTWKAFPGKSCSKNLIQAYNTNSVIVLKGSRDNTTSWISVESAYIVPDSSKE